MSGRRIRGESIMGRIALDELPRCQGFTRYPATECRWGDSRDARSICDTRMRRLLRGFVGRTWREAEAALDRFCATLHADRQVVAETRAWIIQRVKDSHGGWWSGVRTSEGRLCVDDETGILVLLPRPRRKTPTYTAEDLRREPVVIRKGKRRKRR
jgi:hypothetical protein